MRALIDNQLPPKLAHVLADQGVECEHVQALGLGSASDSEIWRIACSRRYVLIGKDSDFVKSASASGTEGQVVRVRTGHCPASAIIRVCKELRPAIMTRLEAGERMVELVQQRQTMNI